MKSGCLITCTVGVLALFSSAPGETIPPGYSQPRDTSPHRRPVIAEDLAVARPAIPPQAAGPNFNLLTLVDVNNIDSLDGSEPSIAVNPEDPNLIVVHGGFSDWGPIGQNNASLYVSTNGGTAWRRIASIDSYRHRCVRILRGEGGAGEGASSYPLIARYLKGQGGTVNNWSAH